MCKESLWTHIVVFMCYQHIWENGVLVCIIPKFIIIIIYLLFIILFRNPEI